MQKKFADVIVNITHENVDRPFTYAVPEELEDRIYPGCPVFVPFGSGNTKRTGYILSLKSDPGMEPEKIKRILEIAEKGFSAGTDLIALSAWMHEHYGCMMNQALKTVLPVKQSVRKRKTASGPDPFGFDTISGNAVTLNTEQQRAFSVFEKDWHNGIRKTYLLYGITGSGKTEVYMEMIRMVLREGKQVILLIPEISMTYQMVSRFRAVFQDKVALIHSKLSAGEKYREFERAKNGEATIMIGPRSAVFAPFSALGLIILDEEHDGAYKNDTVPRYETRDVAEKRAEIAGASVILGSATPCADSYRKAMEGSYTLLRLSERAVRGSLLAKTHIADMREELKTGNRSVFSRLLREMILDRLEKKEQIILFMNRRGYSNFVSCRTCGEAIKCPHCDVSLTLHEDGFLRCHYCGFETVLPKNCPQCGSPYIAAFGTGTQKLERLTKKIFPEARVLRMDSDAASEKNAGESILSEFAARKADILIGTQMVVKGHDLPNVTLVGIMAADTELYVSTYDSAERTFQLITQAAGRAGRGTREGDVVIQTYRPDHYAIRTSASQNYEAFMKNEMAYREIGKYPPAVHILTVLLSSKEEDNLTKAADFFAKAAEGNLQGTNAVLVGPARAGIYKINDYYRKLIYIKHNSYDILLGIKNKAESAFRGNCPEGVSVLYDFT